ncbi:unnamed protein product [Didymodactylos carnosus]|uniref:Uncharacterized protein n=1 Tax=Didymodactylos carnosus TaxID=1234261 RepID=A0A814P4R9_9BILA|nr:unnamed protein product [Didymodactylos carnosus]CAF1102870.1 unnamed protein product [Didymodactylos carnosus]CAF3566695.1 unnamed protein product [Didymodactylos carnosus]CAF3867642.1 unnamed protein product [Didymodactylos carnosus]
MASSLNLSASSPHADDVPSVYFSGICQTISVKCQHRNEQGGLSCSNNLYTSCPHCHLLLCINHIHEHENLLRYEIEQLINETNIVKANIRALTTPQSPFDEQKQRTLCELLERWSTVGKISMSQAALIQHQCVYGTTSSTNNNNNNINTTNKAYKQAQQSQHVIQQQNAHLHQHQQSLTQSTKKRRSGKNKIVTLLMKNENGEYECPNVQCRKSLKCQGITAHVKACAVEWLKENGQYLAMN